MVKGNWDYQIKQTSDQTELVYRGILQNGKNSIHQDGLGNLNVHVPENKAAKHVKQN